MKPKRLEWRGHANQMEGSCNQVLCGCLSLAPLSLRLSLLLPLPMSCVSRSLHRPQCSPRGLLRAFPSSAVKLRARGD